MGKKEKQNKLMNADEVFISEEKEFKRDTNIRNANLRLSSTNIVKKDNLVEGLHVGDTFEITENDILKILEDWAHTKSNLKYYLIKHDKETSNIHYHLVLDFGESMCKFSTLKKKFPYGDIEPCRSVKNCVQYLVHMNHPDKYQYSWDNVKTNAASKLENYKIPGKKTKDIKLQHVLDLIVEGKIKERDIPNMIESDIYIKNATKIKHAFDYRRMQILNDPRRELNVIAFVGPAGSGKTTFVREYAKKYNKTVYFSGSGTDFIGDYHDEDILCLDDYNYNNFDIEDCLKLLDPFTNTTIKSRNKNELFIGDTIFILTNKDITTFYEEADDSLRMAFYRRIFKVFKFEKLNNIDFTTKYTINEIISTDNWLISERKKNKYRKMELKQVTDKVYTFDLKKYISINKIQIKNEAFISKLIEM